MKKIIASVVLSLVAVFGFSNTAEAKPVYYVQCARAVVGTKPFCFKSGRVDKAKLTVLK